MQRKAVALEEVSTNGGETFSPPTVQWAAAQHRFHPTPLRGLLAEGKRAFR